MAVAAWVAQPDFPPSLRGKGGRGTPFESQGQASQLEAAAAATGWLAGTQIRGRRVWSRPTSCGSVFEWGKGIHHAKGTRNGGWVNIHSSLSWQYQENSGTRTLNK